MSYGSGDSYDLPSVSVSSGSSTLCSGETVTLSSTVAGGSWSSSDNSVTVSGGVVTAKSVSVQSTAVITFCRELYRIDYGDGVDDLVH